METPISSRWRRECLLKVGTFTCTLALYRFPAQAGKAAARCRWGRPGSRLRHRDPARPGWPAAGSSGRESSAFSPQTVTSRRPRSTCWPRLPQAIWLLAVAPVGLVCAARVEATPHAPPAPSAARALVILQESPRACYTDCHTRSCAGRSIDFCFHTLNKPPDSSDQRSPNLCPPPSPGPQTSNLLAPTSA